MKHVDHMIKYLSGDLSPEESLDFERELTVNPQLKEEFSDVSLAYRMIGEQLRKKDEEAFSEALYAAMKKNGPAGSHRKKNNGRLWYLLIAVAASAGLLVVILTSQQGTEGLYSSWYKPSDDPVIMTLEMNLRGETTYQTIIKFWQDEDYPHCMMMAENQLSENPFDQYAMLFYLLSSMETDEAAPALEMINKDEAGTSQPLGQALNWYRALALIKAGETSEAAALLTPLSRLPGPYQKQADKLKKKLKK